jgi:hypothetical protein
MTSFEADGVYAGLPYRVLADCSIETIVMGVVVKFKNIDHLLAATPTSPTPQPGRHNSLTQQYDRGESVGLRSPDHYAMLQEAIEGAMRDHDSLRALVYERARFNLKRELLFGDSSVRLTTLVQQVVEFEEAVARIEAEARNDELQLPSPDPPPPPSIQTIPKPSTKAVQILTPAPAPAPAATQLVDISSIRNADRYPSSPRIEEVSPPRASSHVIVIALLAMLVLGTAAIAGILWRWPQPRSSVEVTSERPALPPKIESQISSAASAALPSAASAPTAPASAVSQLEATKEAAAATPKPASLPYPLPSSFGVYALTGNKLVELHPTPISVPDARVALSAEIKTPSPTTIDDTRPAFILFRRDLLNNAPSKLTLRTIAHVARETKIVGGKATASATEGTWRIRNVSRELRVFPIEGHNEMIMARTADSAPLPPGRYALVLNRTGFDFAVAGPSNPEFCLEAFQTLNGAIFTQCPVQKP